MYGYHDLHRAYPWPAWNLTLLRMNIKLVLEPEHRLDHRMRALPWARMPSLEG
jgi:hypothetical protein